MRDTGELSFLKCPPAAAYDRRLRGFDLQVLLALCAHADFSTMMTDHCGVQLAQDFNVTRPAVVRALGRLVNFGYLRPSGFSRRHGKRFLIVLGNPLPVTPVVQATPMSPVTQVAPVTPVAQVTPVAHPQEATCNTGGTLPVPPVAHSTELFQKEKQQGANGRPASRGPEFDFWSGLLLPSDFDAGTPLVQFARDIGFARDDGAAKDALQAQRSGFFAHRANRGYCDDAKRSDFKSWLELAAKKRASATNPAGKKFASVAPANPTATVRANFADGVPTTWHQPWRDTLAALVKSHGHAAVLSWFHEAILTRADDGALLIVPRDVVERNITARYLDEARKLFNVAALEVRSRKKLAA